ncbi:Vesicle trafficking between the ER and Golgi [Clydaea vesicula]|uniref:Vesicle trafficking between the ER and Golgi n=1 Tax=Clydaea vesicula TaxID=447962 RepID=A0AAD5U6Z5_9FUNG|nr:Vesicle trafficking between the ER and Golgi [Clydaea vesicula]
MTIFARQKEALISMLNFNNASSSVWKVLIYDNQAQLIISPLLKVNDLRLNGVTVNMNINSTRHQISDVPAIYFLLPSEENIQKIAKDFSLNLYSEYYLNFLSPLPRSILEALAKVSREQQIEPIISQVYDQYLNFVCLDTNMFTFNLQKSYQILNSPNSNDSEIDQFVTKIANSVLITMKVLPIIRSPRGNSAAEMVASKLEGKLRDYLMNNRGTEFGGSVRPILLLLDRNLDFTSLLHHAWTYSTMVHDVFEMKFNRINVITEDGKKKSYDIDPTDFFWEKYAGLPLPQAAEECSQQINQYKKDVDALTSSCGVESLEEVSGGTKNLQLAITQMPELTERKRIIDMHMNIIVSLMNTVKERQLDTFFSLEEQITRQTKSLVLDTLNDNSKSKEDKLRFFLIYFLSVEDIPKEDLMEYEKILSESGCSTSSITYIKNVLAFTKMHSGSVSTSNSSGGGDLLGKFSSFGNKFIDVANNAGVTGGFENLISGVKNLVITKKNLPITRAVDNFMEGSNLQEFEDFSYFDAKLPKNQKSKSATATAKNQTFSEGKVSVFGLYLIILAIVFVVGGGNYFEYQNLMDYAVS